MSDERDSAEHDPSEDDLLEPDAVFDGAEPGAGGERAAGFLGIDALAERAVDAVLYLVRRATALAGGVLLVVVVCSIGGFLLGYAALSDGMRTVWVLLGGFFMVLAIGSVTTAMWRLWKVRRSAAELVTEVRSLISGDGTTRRTVVETVEATEGGEDEGVVELSRQFFTLKSSLGGRVSDFRALASALTAVTTFPGLMALATLISFAFAVLSLLFLLALVL